MWKHLLEGFTGSATEQLSFRRIVAETGLFVAMLLTSSWLVRG